MATETAPLTHCPNCGAKLARPDLSLCAYCATPLQLGGKLEDKGDETTQRLKRLRENPQFEGLMVWTPRQHELEARARKLRALGFTFFLLALASIAIASNRAGAGVSWFAVGGAQLVLAIALLASSRKLRAGESSKPMLRRPAIVVERRSETAAGKQREQTLYFFTLRFDDGSEGEFRWPGQGTLYEPMTNGMVGVAFTRGDQLIEFKRL